MDAPAFDSSYARLPASFHSRVAPTPVAAPALIRINETLARTLGIDPDWLRSPAGLDLLSGNALPATATPLAMAYAGHQFGHWVPQLGDGRAILVGELRDRDGTRYDLQLKGAGRTHYSRRGDGRAALGPVLREYIVSESMAAFGIPTTRALGMVTTGEPVFRDRPLPGAILARVARSHIRVGTFEYFGYRDDHDSVRRLADYAIERLYPELEEQEQRYRALFGTIVARTAELVARWQLVGFIHGVMNTDNTSISGETLDYGPCAFMDTYDPATVYSSIDTHGRYAYRNQPGIAQWNLASLAQVMLPLLGETPESGLEWAQPALDRFPHLFDAAYLRGLRQKLGLRLEHDSDTALAQSLLDAMTAQGADFTLTFRHLSDLAVEAPNALSALRALFESTEALDAWIARWRERLAMESDTPAARAALMRSVNPVHIPRNHRIAAVIGAAGPCATLRRARGVR
jgi:uncharacterized protein YdiU (UPF0061 family)